MTAPDDVAAQPMSAATRRAHQYNGSPEWFCDFAGTEVALVFSSGYLANLGAVTALTDAGPTSRSAIAPSTVSMRISPVTPTTSKSASWPSRVSPTPPGTVSR